MNMPKLKARDEIGRYTTKRRIYIKWFIRLLIVFISVNFITGLLVDFNEWSSTHKVQSPLYNNATGDEIISIAKRPMIEDVVPVIISPTVEHIVEDTDYSNLTDIEQIVLEVFGERNFQLAMAVVTCESGGDPLAINWSSKDFGLFQINLPVWEETIKQEFGFTRMDLLDPEINARVAYWIFDRDNDGNGSWSPWVGFWNGCALSTL